MNEPEVALIEATGNRQHRRYVAGQGAEGFLG